MSFKRIFFRETQPPTETPPETTLNMEEATTVLFNCFALSQGDNVVLRFIYAVYRNAYGRHILPKNFTKPKKAPKSIADYASNPDTHISRSRRLNNYKDTLKIATREAQIFKIILESPEVLTSLGVNEKFRRDDIPDPIFIKPEEQIVLHMLDTDIIRSRRGLPIKFFPLILRANHPSAYEAILNQINIEQVLAELGVIAAKPSKFNPRSSSAEKYLEKYDYLQKIQQLKITKNTL
jgi:hypothetical protein